MHNETGCLVDTHAHLDEIEDVEAALEEAREAGVAAIVAVGQDYESNVRTLELAAKHPGLVYPALGLHPWNLGRMDRAETERVLQQIEANLEAAFAIGEVGLDYHKKVRALVEKDRQQGVFREVLDIAHRSGKPASIHTRYAWKDGLDIVLASGLRKAVFHWYTGFSGVLHSILDAGYLISATPAVEYHDEHRRAVREAQLENLLLETDSPVTYGREERFQARPRDTIRSLSAVARVKDMEEAEVARSTTANVRRLFGVVI